MVSVFYWHSILSGASEGPRILSNGDDSNATYARLQRRGVDSTFRLKPSRTKFFPLGMALISTQQNPHMRADQYNSIVKQDGFTLLAEGQSPIADLFFVHGLQGHPRKTWTYQPPYHRETKRQGDPPKSKYGIGRKISSAFGRSKKVESSNTNPSSLEVYWPMDLLPYDFPNIRIFTYGYDSKVTHWFKGPAMQLDIYSYGESLLNGVEARRREDPRRRLIFIVHSLGGLIIKDVCHRGLCDSSINRFRSRHFVEQEQPWTIGSEQYMNRQQRFSFWEHRIEGEARST